MQERDADETPAADIQLVGARFKEFFDGDPELRGSQSALAKKLGVSQPAISRVAAGEQLPSGKLILALTKHTRLNLDWLFTGRGDKLLAEGGGSVKVPVADRPLPGAPEQHRDLLNEEYLAGCGVSLTPSMYWLRVQRNDPITGAADQKIRPGDLILLETDRSRFPKVDQIFQELWVVRLKIKGEIQHRLAEVTYTDGGRMDADTFDLGEFNNQMQEEIIIRWKRGEKPEVLTGYCDPGKTTGRMKPRKPPVIPRSEPSIKEENLVARKVLIIRR